MLYPVCFAHGSVWGREKIKTWVCHLATLDILRNHPASAQASLLINVFIFQKDVNCTGGNGGGGWGEGKQILQIRKRREKYRDKWGWECLWRPQHHHDVNLSLHDSSGKFRDNINKSNKTVSASDSESKIIYPVSKCYCTSSSHFPIINNNSRALPSFSVDTTTR